MSSILFITLTWPHAYVWMTDCQTVFVAALFQRSHALCRPESCWGISGAAVTLLQSQPHRLHEPDWGQLQLLSSDLGHLLSLLRWIQSSSPVHRLHDSVCSSDIELCNSNNAPFPITAVWSSVCLLGFLLTPEASVCVCLCLTCRWLYARAVCVCNCMFPRWCRLTWCTIWSSAARPPCTETLSTFPSTSSTRSAAAPTPTARPSTLLRRLSRTTASQRRYRGGDREALLH